MSCRRSVEAFLLWARLLPFVFDRGVAVAAFACTKVDGGGNLRDFPHGLTLLAASGLASLSLLSCCFCFYYVFCDLCFLCFSFLFSLAFHTAWSTGGRQAGRHGAQIDFDFDFDLPSLFFLLPSLLIYMFRTSVRKPSIAFRRHPSIHLSIYLALMARYCFCFSLDLT